MEKIKYIQIYRIIFLILSIAVAMIIFIFSNQSGEKSKTTSRGFVSEIVEFLPFAKKLSEAEKQKIVEDSQPVIRKLAHFSIYTILGINLMVFFKTFEWDTKKQIAFTLEICILYAISDEIHQFFSDGRTPLIKDVLIDTFGGLFGIGIVLGDLYVINNKKVNKEKEVNIYKT